MTLEERVAQLEQTVSFLNKRLRVYDLRAKEVDALYGLHSDEELQAVRKELGELGEVV